ncbi:hypothetical protein FQN50_001103 [Emmonsiellopsis sp. PD_5]|nr:hypothetical protein FQN50_001103 [Emmonsiellopsis sp. PD_5]
MPDDSCANPLLLEWIKEWLDQARERNSKGVTVYKKAYDSMKSCPLTFNHPAEAQQLHGFGPKLCDRLATKLKEYSQKRTSRETNAEGQPAKKPKKAKPYVPTLRSGPYGLILGLASTDEESSIGLTKSQLIELAQPYCDASYTAPPDPSKFYTAWNSMKTLVQKDLVYEQGRPSARRYLLTEDGWEIAKRIKKTISNDETNGSQSTTGQLPRDGGPSQRDTLGLQRPMEPIIAETSVIPPRPITRRASPQRRRWGSEDSDILEIPSPPRPQPREHISSTRNRDPLPAGDAYQNDDTPLSASSFTPIILPPDSFTVELVLDVREIRAVKDRDYIANELSKKGITPIVRPLEVGDVLWIAKCKDPAFLSQHGEEGDEVMLDWIVERKRLDDLIGSIKDGRFHEQKFRLRRSGVQNVIYLIEDFADAGNSGSKYYDHVASAIASTQVVNGYFVKQTKNLDDSIRYLARMTKMLQGIYTGASNNPSPLSIIPTKYLTSPQSYLDLLTRLRSSPHNGQNNPFNPTPRKPPTYTTTFQTFSSLSSKSEMLTLRDLFLKMLMCTRGITADKALEIQRHWRTPREFVEAFEEVYHRGGGGGGGGVNAMENMVYEKLGGLIGRKKVTKVVSKRIAEIWGTNGGGGGGGGAGSGVLGGWEM